MSLSNSPDPAVREAVVRQDLDHVLHPIVQQEVLEA
jgi:taurine-pyruvate aminotransferase